jgi:rhodanese-related sulfurtransferase
MAGVSKRAIIALACGIILCAGSLPAVAQGVIPIPITAEQAFDAMQKQVDPQTLQPKKVVLVDVRSRAEYYWVGTAAKVTEIVPDKGAKIVPDWGKVKLENNGTFISYNVDGRYKRMLVQKVTSMKMSPIAYSVPYQLWNEASRSLSLNANFEAEMAQLAGDEKPVLILFCRSGGRTDAANCVSELDEELFDTIYEIDQPDGQTNHGGFEGSSYGNVFNGYRGFPERDTWNQAHPSVSWKDAGLPIVIGATPPALPVR